MTPKQDTGEARCCPACEKKVLNNPEGWYCDNPGCECHKAPNTEEGLHVQTQREINESGIMSVIEAFSGATSGEWVEAPNTEASLEDEVRFAVNEFHLASLITADRNLGFEKSSENISSFTKKIVDLIQSEREKAREEGLDEGLLANKQFDTAVAASESFEEGRQEEKGLWMLALVHLDEATRQRIIQVRNAIDELAARKKTPV